MTSSRKRRALVWAAVIVAAIVLLRWTLRVPLKPGFDRILYGAYRGAEVLDVHSGARIVYRFHDRAGRIILAPSFDISDNRGAVWSPTDGALLTWSRDGQKSWLPVSLPAGAEVDSIVAHDTETCLVLHDGAGLLFVPRAGSSDVAARTDLVDCRRAPQGWAVLDQEGRFLLLSELGGRQIAAPAAGRAWTGWDYSPALDSTVMAVSRTKVKAVVHQRGRRLQVPFYTAAGTVAAVRGSSLVAVASALPYSLGVQMWLWSPESGQRCLVGDDFDVIYRPVMELTPKLMELLEIGEFRGSSGRSSGDSMPNSKNGNAAEVIGGS